LTRVLSLVERIQLRLGHLSPSQQRVADFILRNLDDSAFMTAVELARHADVSQATVVRFAAEVDLPGYPELQAALQDLLRQRLTAVERFRNMARNPDDIEHVFHRVLRREIQNLERLYEQIDLHVFNAAVKEIAQADRVFAVASRAAGGLALELASFLSWVRPAVAPLVYTAAAALDEVAHTGPGDAVVAFSFPRYARATTEALAFAKERGAVTIAVTDNLMSPVAAVAQYVLLAPTKAISFVDSFAAPTAVLHALVLGVALENEQQAMSNLEHMENIWGQGNIYLSDLRRKDLILRD